MGLFWRGKVSTQPLTSSSTRSPPLRQPCPLQGRGRVRFIRSKKNQGLGHKDYRNRGAIAAGRSPGSQRFSIIGRCTFSLSIFGWRFLLLFRRRSFLNTGVKKILVPFGICRNLNNRLNIENGAVFEMWKNKECRFFGICAIWQGRGRLPEAAIRRNVRSEGGLVY